jgi:hypothetical protein
MYVKIKENKSGDKVCTFKGDEPDMIRGSEIEFLTGSDCPTGKAKCLKIKLTGQIKFNNTEEDNSVERFTVHIEDFSEDVKKGYSRII